MYANKKNQKKKPPLYRSCSSNKPPPEQVLKKRKLPSRQATQINDIKRLKENQGSHVFRYRHIPIAQLMASDKWKVKQMKDLFL